jgi:hypothetical protein
MLKKKKSKIAGFFHFLSTIERFFMQFIWSAFVRAAPEQGAVEAEMEAVSAGRNGLVLTGPRGMPTLGSGQLNTGDLKCAA